MIKEILGEKTAEEIFRYGVAFAESESASGAEGLDKKAFDVGKFLSSLGEATVGAVSKGVSSIPSTLGWTAAIGGGLGVLGATGYDIMKDRFSREDPEERLNTKIEALYARKNRELEDVKWMSKVRSMRDELRRDQKKMTTEEYRKKYEALVKALKEKE